MTEIYMIDGVSLDQLRMFAAAVDAGSFSAAGRRVLRTQSAVSEAVANLEIQLGVSLFDRSGRYPKLTPEGTVLLADARSALAAVDGMRARAKGIAGGIEPELSVVIEVMLPISIVAVVAHAFREQFPHTPLRVFVEALGGAVQPLIDGRASVSIMGSLPLLPDSFATERVIDVTFVMVAAASHPLAAIAGRIPAEELARHIQLVLTDRTALSEGQEFGVMSPSTWRLGDLYAKHTFLLSGLGWGGMPLHTVETDIEEGRLVLLELDDFPREGLPLPVHAVYSRACPPGPAGRWFIERLKSEVGNCRRREPQLPAAVPPGYVLI